MGQASRFLVYLVVLTNFSYANEILQEAWSCRQEKSYRSGLRERVIAVKNIRHFVGGSGIMRYHTHIIGCQIAGNVV
jgi:hypothetical protein